ncbi:hypothetical protein Tsubulata_036805 [Turnera subulata]|uniref:J domain-containing protein n=1 Tax=Turnera subulata TaxID=218843 RepID=A0A9Q0GIG7_9ROSI|nr:hypothetical protein Tsubulata_036805 [Turnera subulata]
MSCSPPVQERGYRRRKSPITTTTTTPTSNSGSNSFVNNASFFDAHDSLFTNSNPPAFHDHFDNIFGGGGGAGFHRNPNPPSALRTKPNNNNNNTSAFDFDNDSIFSTAKSSFEDQDIFGVFNAASSPSPSHDDDIFGHFHSSKPTAGGSSNKNQTAPVGDLLGDFGVKLKPPPRNGSVAFHDAAADDADLLSGFGQSSTATKGFAVVLMLVHRGSARTSQSTFASADDPFLILESTTTTKKSSVIDPLEEMFKPYHSGTAKTSASSPLSPPPKPGQVLKNQKVKTSNASSTNGFEKTVRPGVALRKSVSSSGVKKASSTANLVDDLPSLFQDAPLFGQFEEVDGESEERRRARWERLQRTEDRVAKAVADMNQRDRQTFQEQEERRRIAETVDFEIKRWVAGKEGNMRALLSSLQHPVFLQLGFWTVSDFCSLVLWSDSGWEPVSLTDLITSSSVKKVYRKATLCVHPDKVQQKGATIEQKYMAEKVFDILKVWLQLPKFKEIMQACDYCPDDSFCRTLDGSKSSPRIA